MQPPANPWPRGLRKDQAATYVGVGVTLFDDMVREGSMPAPKRVRSRVIWDRLALDAAFDDLPGGGNDNEDDVWSRVAV